MDVKIDSIIPFDSLRNDLEHVFSVVEKNGKVVLLKDVNVNQILGQLPV